MALKLAITGQGMEKAPGEDGVSFVFLPSVNGIFPGASVSPRAPPVPLLSLSPVLVPRALNISGKGALFNC